MIEILSAVHNIVSAGPGDLGEKYRERHGVYYMNDWDMIVIAQEDAKMVGDMIACYLELTPEQRQTADRICLSSGKDGVVRLIEMLGEIARIRREKGQVTMRTDEIRIFPCFAVHSPKPEKMQRKDSFYQEHGSFESEIILDGGGYLIDGYTSYLLAIRYGVESVPVRYGRRQIVKAAHTAGGKLYQWELPGLLVGKIRPGDKVTVSTARGFRRVKVEAVEEYSGQDTLAMVVRKGRTRRR